MSSKFQANDFKSSNALEIRLMVNFQSNPKFKLPRFAYVLMTDCAGSVAFVSAVLGTLSCDEPVYLVVPLQFPTMLALEDEVLSSVSTIEDRGVIINLAHHVSRKD
ncbi:hypothetical protein PPACK8108_LOCUS22597 [Phakopsora pachyrhizi]|uniref:Uncharacterized protein n=1 Tax=Phakopsora pachyrhizi TaxID=170000 RepID=A0AAV0BNK2_PHAPC|nr:hypothetical protein PPACK8108_LOCUS22597 [Phakopsora pachyrhizi]